LGIVPASRREKFQRSDEQKERPILALKFPLLVLSQNETGLINQMESTP